MVKEGEERGGEARQGEVKWGEAENMSLHKRTVCGFFYLLYQISALKVPALMYYWMESLNITRNILKMMEHIIMDKIKPFEILII